MKKSTLNKELHSLTKVMKKYKSAFWRIFWFSLSLNLLMLIVPIYFGQVIDRMIGSGNMNLLKWISIIFYSVWLFYGLLLVIRSFILNRIKKRIDQAVSRIILETAISATAIYKNIEANQLISDLQPVKTFVTSTGIKTLLDAPWSIIYIIVVFLIHPYLGMLTICSAIIIVSLAFFNLVSTNQIASDGMETSINRASYSNVVISYSLKFMVIIFIPWLALGIGAYVVATTSGQEMTTGTTMMSSVLVNRALVPFENTVKLCNSISSAFNTYKNFYKPY